MDNQKLDVDALNQQVHEKYTARINEAEQEKKYAEETKWQLHMLELAEQQNQEQIREINEKINKFRLSEQRPQYRRDYDLYDPHQKRKERPPRISDNDFCPVSSLQKLEGEDLNFEDRSRKQKEQVQDNLLQQMLENRIRKYAQQKEMHDWENTVLLQDKNALHMLEMESENYKKYAKSLSDTNKHLALSTIERNMQQKMEEEIENRKDIETNFYGDLLTENPLVAKSSFGPHRVVTDRWKGMSKQQVQEYISGQVQQILDKKQMKQQELHEASKWAECIKNQENILLVNDENEKREKSEINKTLALENKQLAQQQKCQQEYINKVLNTNVPSTEYFTQFNTTSR
ncbi:RIB43A-like with coiled-coils protein 2 isoform X2 [Stegodyphus dumicola]|uniref:RIB43A-like with coiled-coils protein 2 isoform X2 n=1 Tax=Stegodyphus dumicola TaxID=202533 RepID=UPI0015A77128|nr:RIB43A-like with coiled-coils protein 2 isoform X2 [Stegodyphus dumicola]